jgi:agmatine deiminase
VLPRKFLSKIQTKKLVPLLTLLSFIAFSDIALAVDLTSSTKNSSMAFANIHDTNRMLVVISAPTADNEYYSDIYDNIIAFDIAYAKAVMGHDNVIVLGDDKALNKLRKELPEDILLHAPMRDIWMRDFTTIHPYSPIQFRYAAAAQSGNQKDADWVQEGFNSFSEKFGIDFPYTDLILDGGNVVDNHNGKAVVTDRFLKDNHLDKTKAKQILKKALHAEQVAIIPADDAKGLAHADGMVMFIDHNTLALNQYEEPYRTEILKELKTSFPSIKIIEIDATWDDSVWDKNFSSACGIYVNSLMTKQNIYMPIFGNELDDAILNRLAPHTSKKIIPIPAGKVCFMGGSVRCLGWQLHGNRAKILIEAARYQ